MTLYINIIVFSMKQAPIKAACSFRCVVSSGSLLPVKREICLIKSYGTFWLAVAN